MRFITKLRTILALNNFVAEFNPAGIGCNSSRDLSESGFGCGFAGQHGTQFEEPLQGYRFDDYQSACIDQRSRRPWG